MRNFEEIVPLCKDFNMCLILRHHLPASIFSMILFAISGSPPEAAAAMSAAAALASIFPPKKII